MFEKITSLFTGNLIKDIGQTVKSFIVNDRDRALLEMQLTELVNKHTELIENEYTKRLQSAHDLQKTALNQNDLFSKRFLYYLTIVLIAFVAFFDTSLIYVVIPPENKDLINVIAGALNITCLAGIVSFFYGSSASSKLKNDTIGNLSK